VHLVKDRYISDGKNKYKMLAKEMWPSGRLKSISDSNIRIYFKEINCKHGN
jgi:hypothetical protein